jgi:DNA-directed RNA polymerase subunit M/transcription elongation factor TFIIS
MPKSIWDFCHLDSSLLKNIEQLNRNNNNYNNNNNNNKDQQNLTSKNDVNDKVVVISSKTDNDEIYALQNSIIESERICHESIVEVNTLLSLLTSIDDYYDDVTKQTNTLMINCEQLLEQQHNYQQTVDILKVTHVF